MIATMDERGVITLQAETGVEAFALRKWAEHALIPVDDLARREGCYWRGSQLLVAAGVPGKAGK